MKWPWTRGRTNGLAAAAAQEDADQRKQAADEQGTKVRRSIAEAQAAVRKSNRFAADVERSMHLKRGPV